MCFVFFKFQEFFQGIVLGAMAAYNEGKMFLLGTS